ncbi:ribosomal RNA-processing protein 7 homolog A isoform X2 [Lycorma delicatula]
MKRHSVREKYPEKPSDRTLFILGIPPYCTEKSLKNLFTKFGAVESVFIHNKPTSSAPHVENSKFFKIHPEIKGFKVAYIVFKNSLTVEEVMEVKSFEPLILSTSEHPVTLGFKKWCIEYNNRIPDPELMQKEIDEFMEIYDKQEENRTADEKAKADPDDEGWVTVTRRGRNPGISRKESVGKRIMAIEKKKRLKKELLNFYRFQIKESKMNQLMKLREKFEEDKKKIAVLKQSRKFKPFK